MIEVQRLTKRYGDLTAVRDLTFAVKAGEVVGFLGANGAGKSTTLRILACFLPATSGTVRIAGFDVFRDSLEARRRIGYLPESVPLYPELRVTEYLAFRCGLKGLRGPKRKSEIDRVVERCGLAGQRRQTIGTLSRGLKQRVGLADALLGSPPLLILDEPTSGLDPLQRVEVRRLLAEMKDEHTVFLSTHILSEVEAMCARTLILNRGELVPESEIGRIRAHAAYEIVFAGPQAAVRSALERLSSTRCVDVNPAPEAEGEAEAFLARLSSRDGADPRPGLVALFAANREHGWRLLALRKRRPSLEEIFAQTTGGAGDA